MGNSLESGGSGQSQAGSLKECGSGLDVKCDAPVGFGDEKATADLGEASFRGEAGTEEDCVQSTNGGLSVRLSLAKDRRRRTCVQRQVSVWGVWVVHRLCEGRDIHQLGVRMKLAVLQSCGQV